MNFKCQKVSMIFAALEKVSDSLSLFDLLFGKRYEDDTIENRTLYDLEITAKRARSLRNDYAFVALWLLTIPAMTFGVFFIGLSLNRFHIKTLIFSIFLSAVFMIVGNNFKHKKSAVELRYEAAQEEYDDLERKKQMLDWANSIFKFDVAVVDRVFEKLEGKLFDYSFDKFKTENRKPRYFEIDELFFEKLEAFLDLRESYNNYNADIQTQQNYNEIKSLLHKHACEYYMSLENFNVKQGKTMVDVTLKIFKELEGKA